jgi:hypothetical protein
MTIRKFFIVFAALVAALTITGCGGGKTDQTTPSQPSTAIKSVALSCAGGSCAVKTNATLQLTATVTCVTTGNCNTSVNSWYVCAGTASSPTNCVSGGSSDLGYVDSTGNYAAPYKTVPNNGSVVVKAVGSDNSTYGAIAVTVTKGTVPTILAFTAWTEDQWGNYTYYLDAGKLTTSVTPTTLVTNTKQQVLNSVVSSDLSTIAYTTIDVVTDPANPAEEIYTIPFSGGTATKIATWTDSHFTITGLDWKADASEFVISAFSSSTHDCGLQTVSADGKTISQITVTTATDAQGCLVATPYHPRYLSDGSILYGGPGSDLTEHLLLVSADRKTKTDLGKGYAPSLSADWKEAIYIDSSANLNVMNIDTKVSTPVPVTLSSKISDTAWCANGNIILVDSAANMYLVDANYAVTKIGSSAAEPYCR